jgi:hypothetical protein
VRLEGFIGGGTCVPEKDTNGVEVRNGDIRSAVAVEIRNRNL